MFARPGLPDEQAYLLARALHRAESPFAARLEQAKESTAANLVAAAPRVDLIHPGALKYLREVGTPADVRFPGYKTLALGARTASTSCWSR